MGFSRQEYWSGLPFLSPGHLPDPGIEPRSPTLQADAFVLNLPWSSDPEVSYPWTLVDAKRSPVEVPENSPTMMMGIGSWLWGALDSRASHGKGVLEVQACSGCHL